MHIASKSQPRIALFPDTYLEANGVATLSRQLVQFAKDRSYPLFVVHGGKQTALQRDGSIETLELKRGIASFPIDKGLYCDPLLTRHKQFVIDQLMAFKPDLVHITGPGDLGFLGLWVAHIMRIPLAASWHTNLHEYLSRRLNLALQFIPGKLRQRAAVAVENQSLRGLLRFYRTAQFVLAPNQMLVQLLQARTGRPAFLMAHGVDLNSYRPPEISRSGNQPFCIGYVGRLTTEKNVRYFAELEQKLIASGEKNFRFLIVGEGGQQNWLKKNLRHADIPGLLRGEQLAAAYRKMDAFVFPSSTDTFGLVILEAMASGLPVVLTPETGTRVGVENGTSGFSSRDFPASLQLLMHDENLRQLMGAAARQVANRNSWNTVFEDLYATYAKGLQALDNRRAEREALAQLSR